MPIGWYIAQYKRRDLDAQIGRYCSVDDYTALVVADGGKWSEAECLGNHAVVKVRASAATLTTIAADPVIMRIPLTLLNDPASTLTLAQRNAIQAKLNALGYTNQELTNGFPGWPVGYTLGDILRFALQRRLRPRYDSATDSIVLDGPTDPTLPVQTLDAAVV